MSYVKTHFNAQPVFDSVDSSFEPVRLIPAEYIINHTLSDRNPYVAAFHIDCLVQEVFVITIPKAINSNSNILWEYFWDEMVLWMLDYKISALLKSFSFTACTIIETIIANILERCSIKALIKTEIFLDFDWKVFYIIKLNFVHHLGRCSIELFIINVSVLSFQYKL